MDSEDEEYQTNEDDDLHSSEFDQFSDFIQDPILGESGSYPIMEKINSTSETPEVFPVKLATMTLNCSDGMNIAT